MLSFLTECQSHMGILPDNTYIVWAYASGLYLNGDTNYICPCNSNVNTQVPSFIGNDYYCETGNNVESSFTFDTLYTNDPLWDGQQCVGTEAPCCTHSNMPWFIKTLNETTTEDIELRVCGNNNEDTPLDVIELLCTKATQIQITRLHNSSCVQVLAVTEMVLW